MNTRIWIRILLVVLALGLVPPAIASADSIPIAYVVYQNTLPEAPDGAPGTNDFYFEWLVDPLVFTEASFSVSGVDADGFDVGALTPDLALPLYGWDILTGFSFLTTDSLTEVAFHGVLAPGVLMLDGQAYSIAAQEISGGMAAGAAPGLVAFGLGDPYDLFVLEAQADPIPVPVPEGGPGTLGLTTLAALLAAARWRLDRHIP